MKRIAIVLSSFFLVALANAASFDCAKASTKVEHLICDNPEISKLDEDLVHSYKMALQDESRARTVKQEQMQWLRGRNKCIDVGCVKKAYQDRISLLSSGSALSGAKSKEADPERKMIEAITNNDIAAVRKLLGEGTKLPKGVYLFTPLDIAARNNNSEMLSLLLDNGADPVDDIEAMKSVLNTCNKKMFSALVNHGYKIKGNPSYYGPYDPLPWAAQFGCKDIVEYLVTNGADLNSYKPLRVAASQCHVETVKYLLSKVANPDLADGDNRTPLWGAAISAVNRPAKREACMAVIKELIQAGANPERALIVPTENPALKLPKDDKEVMKLLNVPKNKQ